MSDTLARLQLALADRYRVARELGAGGMATVYLAHDVRHERDVAIKVLHPELGAALGAERFLAEIKTTAKLQHPHILPLLDSGAADGLLYYVMPFIAGETLRVRLEREKVLPIADAVRIARDVGGALDYAHRQGVVHRDIKPENILLHDGSAVVADFGIALAVQHAGGARMTQTGLSLGTPQYMSPEQAMGERTVDARSDLYALAAVTYEMLTGDPPFTGNTVQAIVAKVLTERPVAPRAIRDTIPPHVEQAVLVSLAKLPADRATSAKEFADALNASGTLSGALVADAHTNGSMQKHSSWPLSAMGVVTVVALTFALWPRERSGAFSAADDRLRVSIAVSDKPGDKLDEVSMAPDGHAIAITVADTLGRQTLRVRRFDSSAVITIANTEGAESPAWSPDSKSIAYVAGRVLYRVEAGGGRPQKVADVGAVRFGIDWLTDDLISVSTLDSDTLMAIPLKTGVRTGFYHGASKFDVVTGLWSIGDGRHAVVRLFAANDSANPYRYDLIDFGDGLPAKKVRRLETLTKAATKAYAPSFVAANGQYLVEQDNGIWVADFDQRTFELTSEPRRLVTDVNTTDFAVSRTGRLVFREVRKVGANRMLLVGRTGKQVAQIGEPAVDAFYEYYGPRFSPDSRSIAYEWHNGHNSGDLWRMDLTTMRPIRQTRDELHHNAFLAWSPDGKQIVFESTRSGHDLYVRDVDGSIDRKLQLRVETGFPTDWSPDGTTMLFGDRSTGGDVWATTPRGDSAWKVLATDATEMHAVFSPNGKYIAYASDEQNSRFEVFVRRWPITEQRWLVSTNGGDSPRWRADGKELLFVRNERGGRFPRMMSADIDLSSDAPKIGTERSLFQIPMKVANPNLRGSVNYDVRGDGQQFVAIVYDDVLANTTPTLELYQNWPAAAKASKTPR